MSLSPFVFQTFSASPARVAVSPPGSGFAHDRAAPRRMNLVPTARWPTDFAEPPLTGYHGQPAFPDDRRNGSPDAPFGAFGG